MAQLAERFLDTEEVTGSNPVPPTRFPRDFQFHAQTDRFLAGSYAFSIVVSESKVKITELPFSNFDCLFEAADIPALVYDWLLECELRQVSRSTRAKYRIVLDRLSWFLASRGCEPCGKREIQQFLLYLRNGHEEPAG